MASYVEDDNETVRGDIAAPEDTVSTWGKKELILFTKHKGTTSPDPNDKDIVLNNISGGGYGKIDRRVTPDSFSQPSPMIHETKGLEGRVKLVACSTNKTLVLLGNGKLFAWGEWSEDEGDDPKWRDVNQVKSTGTSVIKPYEIRVNGLGRFTTIDSISAGHDHFALLTSERRNNLFTWGNNARGQLGRGKPRSGIDDKAMRLWHQPKRVENWRCLMSRQELEAMKKAKKQTITDEQAWAQAIANRKKSSDDAADDFAEKSKDYVEPVRIIQVVCSNRFTLAVTDDNLAFSWGKNHRGQLGLGQIGRPTYYPYKIDAVENLGFYKKPLYKDPEEEGQESLMQVMFAVGKRHAVSWLHVEKLNSFSEAYKLEHNDMKRRLKELGEKVKQQSAKIRGMEISTVQPEDGAATAAQGLATTAISRRVTDDVTLNETGDMITELQQELDKCKLELDHTIDQLKESGAIVAKKSEHITSLQVKTKQFWKLADSLEYEYQRIDGFRISTGELNTAGDSRISEALDQSRKVNSQIDEAKDLKKRQAGDQRALARASEKVVVEELKQLATIRRQTSDLEERKKSLISKRDSIKHKVQLLNRLYVGHDKLIRRKYVGHNNADVFDLAATARSLFQRLRACDLTDLSRNTSLVRKLTNDKGGPPGIDNLLHESEAQLVDAMVDADNFLGRRIDITDARRELADLLKEILRDIADLRRRNNSLTKGILTQAKHQLDMVVRNSTGFM